MCISKEAGVTYSPMQRFDKKQNKWYMLSRKNWNINTKIIYLPSHDKCICIGIPLYPVNNNTYAINTPNRVHVHDYNADTMYTTMIQLPRTDTIYSIGLTHSKSMNNKLVHGYINSHYKKHIPIQMKKIISTYVDIWMLHIIDNQTDHYMLDVDIIMTFLYFNINHS